MADSAIEPRSSVAIRASKLSLTMACPASLVDDDGPRLVGDKALSTIGTSAHRVLTGRIAGQRLDTEDVAEQDKVDADELGMLVGRSWSIWIKELQAFFADPIVEKPLAFRDEEAGLFLSGHPDVISTMALQKEKQIRLADFKTGYLDDDHEHQLRGYAWLCLNNWPTAQSVYAAVIRPREGTRDGWVWTRDELHIWYADLLSTVRRTSDYNPDPRWCSRCPRGLTCDAKTAMLRQAASILLELPANDVSGLGEPRLLDLPDDPVEKGTLLSRLKDRAKHLTEVAEFATKLVKIEVLVAGGSLPTNDGKELVVSDQKQRHIVPSLAWAILRDALGEEALIEECVKIGKGDVEAAIKKTAGTGAKGQVAKELIERLDQAGAMETVVIQKLETKKSPRRIGVSA